MRKARTDIWKEETDKDDDFVASRNYCFGYSQEELIDNGYSITDMLFLLAKGELPSKVQRSLLDALGVALCNPGPRHPATRAAMEVAVSKTRIPHILPISLVVMGGDLAAGGVEPAMRFMRLHRKKPAGELVGLKLEEYAGSLEDTEIFPGFGPRFGQREPLYVNLAKRIRRRFANIDLPYLDWILGLDLELEKRATIHAVRANGLAAAILLDLGFHPRFGTPVVQWLAGPGLLAHGVEKSNKPLTDMPFVTDDSYHYTRDSGDDDD